MFIVFEKKKVLELVLGYLVKVFWFEKVTIMFQGSLLFLYFQGLAFKPV